MESFLLDQLDEALDLIKKRGDLNTRRNLSNEWSWHYLEKEPG